MFEIIQRRLSLKVSLVLAVITVLGLAAAAYLITTSESKRIEQLTI